MKSAPEVGDLKSLRPRTNLQLTRMNPRAKSRTIQAEMSSITQSQFRKQKIPCDRHRHHIGQETLYHPVWLYTSQHMAASQNRTTIRNKGQGSYLERHGTAVLFSCSLFYHRPILGDCLKYPPPAFQYFVLFLYNTGQ